MNIFVTGGGGYIGSVMTKQLLDSGHTVSVFDDFSNGSAEAVDKRAQSITGDLADQKTLNGIFEKTHFDAVMHFAGVISMAESMMNPAKYIRINFDNTLNLLEVMKETQVKMLIFSSTAGVYGNPIIVPIPESHQTKPTNPYGESKLMVEKMLWWYDQLFGIKSMVLRYFNAAGASLDGILGENHKDETHIIPLAINALLNKKEFTLYGSDYQTPDGTCVRDYIHVEDLCNAHLLALVKLAKYNISATYNVGTGKGYSNKEVVAEVESVSGQKLSLKIEQRRPGDADQLIADPTKIKKELNWEPEHSDLTTIVTTAWNYHQKHAAS